MATLNESRFRAAVKTAQAKEVCMNAFDAAFFSQTSSIGTDGLGSCSVVLIVSPYAAILGHVAPQPDNADGNDPYAGDNHVRHFMDRLTKYYVQCQNFFPNSPYSWVVCAVFGNSVALPDQQNIMETTLRAVNLNVDTSKTYPVPTLRDHPDRGSVFVDARGSTIQVYVEGSVVKEIPKVSASTTAQSYATSSSNTPLTTMPSMTTLPQQQTQQIPSSWTWSPQHKLYYRKVGNEVVWSRPS
ncbi:hypothetical protein AA0119_g13315 [Alternaria tenuissima]|jgi:hypothetical protein|uniref:WW domain-containing protein n=1 Tax=Alternaria tenuissima TaxID=119927 RepID=A0ABY0FP68_9PLEO|nr:hypothetical protein AA0119_g13315 [Alternaria tenuissima]RYO00698.1 hypothetical protein AA0121_g13358 [Alternaria tenuissima]RYO45337.1 hypothetical protein AA0116_g13328 [Alternaria tenuissima]